MKPQDISKDPDMIELERMIEAGELDGDRAMDYAEEQHKNRGEGIIGDRFSNTIKRAKKTPKEQSKNRMRRQGNRKKADIKTHRKAVTNQ